MNVMSAGNEAVSALRSLARLVHDEEQPSTTEPRPSAKPPTLTPLATGPLSIDWACVSVAETGGDFTAHGSSYSSAYGVMNEAVRENAPPDVAERILNGTASPSEELAMAQSVAAKHGFNAWAPSTVARCSR